MVAKAADIGHIDIEKIFFITKLSTKLSNDKVIFFVSIKDIQWDKAWLDIMNHKGTTMISAHKIVKKSKVKSSKHLPADAKKS